MRDAPAWVAAVCRYSNHLTDATIPDQQVNCCPQSHLQFVRNFANNEPYHQTGYPMRCIAPSPLIILPCLRMSSQAGETSAGLCPAGNMPIPVLAQRWLIIGPTNDIMTSILLLGGKAIAVLIEIEDKLLRASFTLCIELYVLYCMMG